MVDLRIGSERRQLHFGGGFACVVAPSDARTDAARWIAATIVDPGAERQQDAGTDRAVGGVDDEPVWRLQSPMLPLQAPAVLDRDVLQMLWRSDCARRLDEIGESRAALRSDRAQLEADIDRLRTQPPLTPAGRAPRPGPAAAEAELEEFKAAARRFVVARSLLTTIDRLAPVPSPAALELAGEWEAELDEGRAPAPQPEPAPKPAPADAATPDPVDAARRAELERLHNIVTRAQARIFGRRVVLRKRAVAKYNQAVARERAALAGAGVDSYAEFLLESSGTAPRPDPREVSADEPVAEVPIAPEPEESEELEAAAAPEADQYDESDEAAPDARAVRLESLRGRARELLGHEPGDDAVSELRNLRVESPVRSERVAELESVLRDAGLTDLDDVVERARVFVESSPSVHIPQPPTWAMRVGAPEIPLREIEAIEEQIVAGDEALARLDVDAIRVEAMRDSDLLRLGPDDFVRVVDALLDAYRAGEVLEGHLPLVLDGVLDGMAADSRDAAVLALAKVDDAQVIVVTDDETVTRRVGEAGGTIVRWPGAVSERPGSTSGH